MRMSELVEKFERRRFVEASYPGNMGAMEMVRFYQIATREQEREMEKLLNRNKIKKAWSLLQKVTGVKLRNPSLSWNPMGSMAHS